MKKGKEIKTEKFKNFKVVFGSVDNKNSKAVYINISSWAEPKNEVDVGYTRVIRNLNKKVKQTIFNNISENNWNGFILDRTIVDLDIRESGIKLGKRSFMNCEITLFTKEEVPITNDTLKDSLNLVTSTIINEILNKTEHFNFYNRKK